MGDGHDNITIFIVILGKLRLFSTVWIPMKMTFSDEQFCN